ncbi:PREDICTED: death-associated protein kinase 1-like [Priapulus caudatus]|uniref:Death-associated protein kinase 1-like n=1 Tax=Priapulus caudatus TaxID=37621 RepID=A0ABM1ENC2_PRICU|nr:PREDICTED: death-associated protein kinase 1-like [Priapulus caudatus]
MTKEFVIKVFGSSGVGKTTLIESLKTGWMGSLFRRRGSLMGSQRGQKGAPLNANNNANTEQMMARSCGGGGGGGGGSPKQKTVEDVSANGSYTRGVSIELASVPGVGELSVWEFSGVDTYHLLYDHFIGNVSCVHVVVYRLDDPDELQLRQLTYWLEFLRARLPHEHPIGHCGYAADLAIADETYVVDAYVPSGAGVRALRSHLGDEKRLVAAALPPRTGFLDAVSARLPAWRRCARAFPALSWAQFKDTVRQQVNPLAGDEHLRELTQQLQLAGDALYLKGGSQSMQDVVVIAPRWLCGDVVGFLLAHDHIAATHGTGCYTVDNLQLLFPEADALDLLQVLEALQMCTQCDDDGEIVYEFPCLNFTETLPGLWEREGAYEGGSAVYGGYRLRPVGCDQLLNSVFARIQVQLRRSLLENHDPDNDLYQWHGGSKLCSGVLESLITLEGAGEVEVKARGPVDAQLSCFYFLDDVVSVVEAAIVEVCPGLALQRLVLSAADLAECQGASVDLAECQGASVDLAECQGAFVDLADCHGSVDLAECQDSRDLAECQRSVDLPESQDSGELARCQESDDPCLESVDLGDRESNEDQDCDDGDTGADVETYTAADVLRSQLRRGFVVANAAGSEEHLVDLLCFGAADALHALTLGVDLPAACLDPATRRRLASVLDPADPWGKDWCLLAVALGLNDLLPSIDAGVGEGESRTAAAITEWARREGATVGALVEKLQELGRADAAEAVLEAAPLYRVAAEDGGAAERQAAEARIRSLSSDLSRLSR